MNKRIKEIDRIKVFATICVVLLHAGNLGRIFNVIHYMAGCAIPLFFMCSGAVILNKDELSLGWVFRKICRIVLFISKRTIT